MASCAAVQAADLRMNLSLSAQVCALPREPSRAEGWSGAGGIGHRVAFLVARIRTMVERNSGFSKYLLIGLGRRNRNALSSQVDEPQ